jgi:hypothetical protein
MAVDIVLNADLMISSDGWHRTVKSGGIMVHGTSERRRQ